MTMLDSGSSGIDALRVQLSSTTSAIESLGGVASGRLRPLHDLRSWCENFVTLGTSESSEPADLAAVYLLGRLLDDTLENLTGDFLYDQTAYDRRTKFFVRLVADLDHLASVEVESTQAWVGTLGNCVFNFVQTIDELNALAEQRLMGTPEQTVDQTGASL